MRKDGRRWSCCLGCCAVQHHPVRSQQPPPTETIPERLCAEPPGHGKGFRHHIKLAKVGGIEHQWGVLCHTHHTPHTTHKAVCVRTQQCACTVCCHDVSTDLRHACVRARARARALSLSSLSHTCALTLVWGRERARVCMCALSQLRADALGAAPADCQSMWGQICCIQRRVFAVWAGELQSTGRGLRSCVIDCSIPQWQRRAYAGGIHGRYCN